MHPTADQAQPNTTAPLRGLRVLAVEQYGAGPFGTSYPVNLGAEVIKTESPVDGGDVSRNLGPHSLGGNTPSSDSLLFQDLNTGKKSLTLDLRGVGSFQALRNPVRYSPLPPPQRTSPQLGGHTQELLAEMAAGEEGASMASEAGREGEAGQAPNPRAGADYG